MNVANRITDLAPATMNRAVHVNDQLLNTSIAIPASPIIRLRRDEAMSRGRLLPSIFINLHHRATIMTRIDCPLDMLDDQFILVSKHLVLFFSVVEEDFTKVMDEWLQSDRDVCELLEASSYCIAAIKLIWWHHDVHVCHDGVFHLFNNFDEVIFIAIFRVEAQAHVIEQMLLLFPPAQSSRTIADETNLDSNLMAEFCEFVEVSVQRDFTTSEFEEELFVAMLFLDLQNEVLYYAQLWPLPSTIMQTIGAVGAFKVAGITKTPIHYEPFMIAAVLMDDTDNTSFRAWCKMDYLFIHLRSASISVIKGLSFRFGAS